MYDKGVESPVMTSSEEEDEEEDETENLQETLENCTISDSTS